MRAAVLIAQNEPLVIEDLRSPDLGPHDVRLRVDASGVCHSDLSVRNGLLPLPLPVILGHEGAGTVLEVGADVTRTKVGDRVICSFSPVCGNCFYCLNDESNLCLGVDGASTTRGIRGDGTEIAGMAGLGTFSDELVTPEWRTVTVHTDLPSEQLALIGCGITTGVGAALNTARIKPGSTVAVIGCGGVGQSVIQGARIAGASRIFAIDPVEMKRKTAEGFGATDLIDPGAGDPIGQVKSLTGGLGADYAFEVIGLPETMVQAFNTARKGGSVVIVGMPSTTATVTFPAFQMFASEKKILGSLYGSANVRRDFPRFVRLAESGRLDLESMVTRRIGIDEVNDAFRAMENGEVIRSVIV